MASRLTLSFALSLPVYLWRRSRRSVHHLRRARVRVRGLAREVGMTTAEYAIGTLAACGFAALLVTILRSGEVHGMLVGIIRRALALGG